MAASHDSDVTPAKEDVKGFLDDVETYSGFGDSFPYDSADSDDGVFDGDQTGTSKLKQDATIYVGQIFKSKGELQQNLHTLKLEENFDFRVEKSHPSLLVVKCSHDSSCKWMVRASKISTESEYFMVRKYEVAHTCPKETRRCRNVPSKIMTKILLDDKGVDAQNDNPEELKSMMLRKYGVDVTYWNSWKSVQRVKDLVRGTAEDGYTRLPSYLHLIKKYNPGTITHIKTDDAHRFKYLFISFGACKKGFKCLRKVVVVDGTFLKGKYKGLLLVATAQDGNYNIFPLAFGIVDVENDASWEWFFTRLKEVVRDSRDLVIISDRHKSIGNSIAKVFPAAHRGICTYHMKKNIISKFRGSKILGLVKEASKAYTVPEFAALFDEIRRRNPRLHTYLHEGGVHMWSRANFRGNRYNIMTSNPAESLNSVLRKARELPIVTLLEYVGEMLSRWFCERRTAAALLKSTITPRVKEKLEKRVDIGKHFKVIQINATRYQVKEPTGDYVVDFAELKCTCRSFDVHKIPCVHAVIAADKTNFKWESLVHRHYSKINLFGAYAESINPIEEWTPPTEIGDKICLPPLIMNRPGRPKKKRFATALENSTQVKRARRIHTCSNCGNTGHNRKTCNAAV